MYKVLRLKFYSDNSYKPSGSIDHDNPLNERHPKSIAWKKLNSNEPVDKFRIDTSNEHFQADFKISKSVRDYKGLKDKAYEVINNDLKSGAVFDDGLDEFTYNPSTDTHYLGRITKESGNGGLVFSKDITPSDRLTYTVSKPDSSNTSKVEVNNFIMHSYNGVPYSESVSAIGTSHEWQKLIGLRKKALRGERLNSEKFFSDKLAISRYCLVN